MKFSLLVLMAALVMMSCSKSDESDDAASVASLTSDVVSKELPQANQIPAASEDDRDEENMDNDEEAPVDAVGSLNDQQVISLKSAFFQVEQRTNKEIGLEFALSGNSIKSSISKRCESADAQALKDCLLTIRKSLEDFIREGGAVLGDNNPDLFRSELVKLSLASDWLRKVNQNAMMVR